MLAKSCKLQLQRRKTKTENENNSFFSSVALPLAELVREADGGHQLSGCQTHTQSTEREREGRGKGGEYCWLRPTRMARMLSGLLGLHCSWS